MGSMHTVLEGTSIHGPLLTLLGSSTYDNDDHHDHTNLGCPASYFFERARGGSVIMVMGGTSPNYEVWLSPFATKLTTEGEAGSHRFVTKAVHFIKVPK